MPLRPSFHEIPVGFSTATEVLPPAAHGLTSVDFDASGVPCYLTQGADLTSVSMRSTENINLSAKQWSGVGVTIPWATDEREVYFVSVCSVAEGNQTIRCIPFVGLTNVDSGLGTVHVKDLLHCDALDVGAFASCHQKGVIRSVLALDTPPSNDRLVIGVGFLNQSGSAGLIGQHRTTINVVRYNEPDLGLQLVVQ